MFAVRSYANNNGFGIQFAFEGQLFIPSLENLFYCKHHCLTYWFDILATIEFKNGFSIIEDIIGWPGEQTSSVSS